MSAPRLGPPLLLMVVVPAALGAVPLVLPRPAAPPDRDASREGAPSADAIVEAAPSAEPDPAAARAPAPDGFDPHRLPEAESLRTVRAIVQRRPIVALRYLRALEDAFPASEHRVERERWIIECLINLGRESEAKERGLALLAENHGGPDAWRVRFLLTQVLRIEVPLPEGVAEAEAGVQAAGGAVPADEAPR